LIKAGNRKNFAIEIVSIQREGKYAYQTGRWTLDQVKDNGEVTKVGEYRLHFEEQQCSNAWGCRGQKDVRRKRQQFVGVSLKVTGVARCSAIVDPNVAPV
jgi:hypothetical protein